MGIEGAEVARQQGHLDDAEEATLGIAPCAAEGEIRLPARDRLVDSADVDAGRPVARHHDVVLVRIALAARCRDFAGDDLRLAGRTEDPYGLNLRQPRLNLPQLEMQRPLISLDLCGRTIAQP